MDDPQNFWPAPAGAGPLHAAVVLPGSKSQTSRALAIGAIAKKPTRIYGALASRDTYMAAKAIVSFGASIEFADDGDLTVIPPKHLQGGATIDCGQAGTVMRFGSALAAFADGKTTLVCDPSGEIRPIGPLMDSLKSLGAKVKYLKRKGFLPVRITGIPARKKRNRVENRDGELQVGVDTSSSSQYLSALLLASPLIRKPTILRAEGQVPSWPYVAMSLDMLAEQGVDIERVSSWSWRSDPTRPRGTPIHIEPDLANAGPFLAAALMVGGQVTICDWPKVTDQVGRYWLEILPRFGASLILTDAGLTVSAPAGLTWEGVDIDMGPCGELAPTVAALCVFASSASTLRGVGHLRGHETDRLEALATEIRRLGGQARVLPDGIHITPGSLHAADLESYSDHRMATFGAIVGLRLPGCRVADINTTSKTLPHFPQRWRAMMEGEPSPVPLTLEEVFQNPETLSASE